MIYTVTVLFKSVMSICKVYYGTHKSVLLVHTIIVYLDTVYVGEPERSPQSKGHLYEGYVSFII